MWSNDSLIHLILAHQIFLDNQLWKMPEISVIRIIILRRAKSLELIVIIGVKQERASGVMNVGTYDTWTLVHIRQLLIRSISHACLKHVIVIRLQRLLPNMCIHDLNLIECFWEWNARLAFILNLSIIFDRLFKSIWMLVNNFLIIRYLHIFVITNPWKSQRTPHFRIKHFLD